MFLHLADAIQQLTTTLLQVYVELQLCKQTKIYFRVLFVSDSLFGPDIFSNPRVVMK